MLVLSRRKHETIVIETPAGERIEVSVVEIQGHKVRLGVAADRSVIINRGEIQRLIYGRLTGQVRDGINQSTEGLARRQLKVPEAADQRLLSSLPSLPSVPYQE